MREPDDPRIAPVTLRRTLVDQGYDDRAIARLVRDGVLAKVRRGAYTDARAWGCLDELGRHGLRARAVLQQAKTQLVLSHVSGLGEFDAPAWGVDLADVHVTRADGRLGRHEAGVHQHCGALLPGDIVRRHGVEVVSATRLALEITTVAGTEASLSIVNHLLHHGETTPELLGSRYRSMEHWPKTLHTDVVLRLADGRIETVGESRTYHLCYRHGLPMPVPQYPILDGSGRVVARVDFAWPRFGVFLEFDGRVKYEKLLRPGQSASDVVIAEKRREELICRLTGWRCIRIVWSDLEHPARTAAMIRDVVTSSTTAA
jgi:hypothetical protein